MMKLVLEDNKVIIFLNKLYIKKFDFEDKKETEKFLRDLINRVKNKYNLDFSGYYNINIYIDKIYGFIISIEKEDLEYFDYFNGQIEFSVKVIKSEFLYKMEELLTEDILSNFIIYKNKDKFYLKPKEVLTNREMGLLLENAEIIFNTQTKEIIQSSKVMKG